MTALEVAKSSLSLPDLMTRLGLGEHAKKSARCPLHEDRNNSFSVFRGENGEWAWNCFAGCGGGDAAAFLAKVEGISNGDACRRLIEMSGGGRLPESFLPAQRSVSTARGSTPAADAETLALPTPMSPSDNERALAIAATLRDDLALCERIARTRGWRAETINELAWEPSLGWHEGKLAFLYESGVKLRWRKDGKRIIRWAFGKPWLWRGGFLWGRSTIYVCEGETDAISLIDAGIEKDGLTLAIGIPSATTFHEEWAVLFKGKNVILALDGDKAGLEATARIAALLRPVVSSLGQVNWGGLHHAN